MITVTEHRYLDGTGDVPKDIEYKFDHYTLGNDGSLRLYNESAASKEEVYYTPGSFYKVRQS